MDYLPDPWLRKLNPALDATVDHPCLVDDQHGDGEEQRAQPRQTHQQPEPETCKPRVVQPIL